MLVPGLLMLLSAGTARAELTAHLDYQYYEVPAHRFMSLREELNAASPVHEDGRTFHAHTNWHVYWHFQYRELPGGGCAIDSAHTELTATIILPGPADPAIARDRAFVTYLAALKVHEQGHYQIGRETAAAIDRGLLALPPQDTCTGLGITASDFANAQLARARDTESAYDRDTGHGRTQGATLP